MVEEYFKDKRHSIRIKVLSKMSQKNSVTSSCSSMDLSPQKDEHFERRVQCTNTHSLDKVLKIVAEQVSLFADKQNMGDRKSEFLFRFMEVFKNSIQDNILVNGLPFVLNRDMSSTQHAKQEKNIYDTLMTDLCQSVTCTAQTRKEAPAKCRKLFEKKCKKEVKNLKELPIQHNVSVPSTSDIDASSLETAVSNWSGLEQMITDIDSSSKKVKKTTATLTELKRNIEFVDDILQRNHKLLKAFNNNAPIEETEN